MNKHKNVKSKMIKTRILQKHPIISQHVPETLWFNSWNLEDMLARYSMIYIKPNAGNQGNEVIRVKKLNEVDCVLSYDDTSKEISLPDAAIELETIITNRRFILQQGIDLATYRNCPFDIRMVMQKPYDTWELTLTSAKVALKEDAVVTNVSKGAQDYPLIEILQKYDQKEDPLAVMRELVNLAHQISNKLGSKLPFRILGLDMAIDKEGKVWFIEANTLPQCARCKEVNDEAVQNKFEDAKRIIRNSYRR
jgi:hypothetical protein